MPWMRSITITFGAAAVPVDLRHVQQVGAGEVALAAARRSPPRASGRARRGWSSRTRSRPRAGAGGAPSPSSRARARASAYSTSRSRSISARMPGRSTLTTTSAPIAQARGVHLRDRGRGQRRRRRTRANTSVDRAAVGALDDCAGLAPGNGGTRSCSFASSSAMSGGSRSRRVESAWPNFTKIGPSSSSARRRRSPRVPPRRRSNQVQGER